MMDIKIDFTAEYSKFKNLLDFTKRDMRSIGIYGRKLIQSQLNKGISTDGRKFIKYSESYAKYKRKLGKNPKIVDMQDSGTMRNSLHIRTGKGYVAVEPLLHRKIAAYHHYGTAKGNKRRKWIGYTSDSENKIKSYVQAMLDKKMRLLSDK